MRYALVVLVIASALLAGFPAPSASGAPPHAQAAATPTHIQLIAPDSTTVGIDTTLMGVLHDSSLNQGIGGATLSFSLRTTFGWLLLGNGTTNAAGKAAIDYRPVDSGGYTVRVAFAGNMTYAPANATTSLTVLPSAPSRPPGLQPDTVIVLIILATVGGVWATYGFVALQVLAVRADAPVRPSRRRRGHPESEVKSSMEEQEMEEEPEIPKRAPVSSNKPSRAVLGLAVAALVVAAAALALVGVTALAPKPAAYTPGTIKLQIAIVPDLQGAGWDVWLPNELVVHLGDTVELTIYNADEMPHGLQIAQFNIDKPIPEATANATGAITPSKSVVTFVADQVGQFLIKCNVVCGPGHERMIGTLVVLPD